MTTNSLKLLGAFIEALSEQNGHASVRHRGGHPGYVHVIPAGLDPTNPRNRHVVIEMRRATVAVTDELCESINAHPRPNVRIEDDPLGYSAGPQLGRFKWALSYGEILTRWGSELAFAREVAATLQVSTKTENDDEGDYA